MAFRKWGTVRANSQLVKGTEELTRKFSETNQNAYLASLTLAAGGEIPPYGPLVRGYGDALGGGIPVTTGYWPGVSGGVLTVNDATAGHEVIMSGDVLALDNGAAKAEFALTSPDSSLLVDE